MSEIKYVSPSTLTHYDEKIKDIIDDKVDKIDGKGLSANDLTNELKTEYDDTVAKAHEHSNIDVLKKFSEDSNGMPLYDNDKFYDGFVANDLTTTDEGYALDARQGKVLGDRVSELETPTFTQATTRANIASGESTKTILGKIKKYFADLKSHAFNAPANNLTTTTTGYALDATQGKALQDKLGSTDISAIGDGTVTNAISTLNSNLSTNKITPTISSNVAVNYLTIYRVGKIVHVSGHIYKNIVESNWVTIATGLPKAIEETRFIHVQNNGITESGKITVDGELCLYRKHKSGENNVTSEFNLTYVTSE